MLLERSGLSARELFSQQLGLSYNDFTILDTMFSNLTPEQISLKSDLGKGVILQTPIIASPMDTVTNSDLSIALALQGGIGCIHYNHKDAAGKPSIDAQIEEIEQVKRFQNGFIPNPCTVSPSMSISEAIQQRYGSVSIDNFPVTQDGKSNGRLVGLLRKQDYSQSKHTDLTVAERMLPLDKLIMGRLPITLEEAEDILWQEHIPSLPIIDTSGNLTYLVTRSDIDKREQYPLATCDNQSRLRVLFAVDTRPEQAYDRLLGGFSAGADGVVVDTSQGYTRYARDMLCYIMEKYPDKLVVGGNVSTAEAVNFLKEEKIDAYRNGQGPGSICTTAGTIGISRAGAMGVYEGARMARSSSLRTIADGGLRQVGDIVKALSLGAHTVMLGNLLAGTAESPGEMTVDQETGNPVKVYRGMGSAEANVGGVRGYSKLPQGISGKVPYRGSVHAWIPLITDGIKSAMEVLDCVDIQSLHEKTWCGILRYEQRSIGAMKEAGVHDLQ